jgi:microcin C transport system permease protein
MREYVLRRLMLIPLTFIGITFVVFCFTRFVPGGPIEQAMMERQQADQKRTSTHARPTGPASPEELDTLKRRYGFDKPLYEAYAIWLGVMPGPGQWAIARLDQKNQAEVEVPDETKPSDGQHEAPTVKLTVEASPQGYVVFGPSHLPRQGWLAESAPLPDDPEKAPRVVVYHPTFSGVLQWNLGYSTESEKPVWEEIKTRLPISCWFGFWALFLAYAISIPLGVFKALKRDSFFDSFTSQILFLAYSVPSYVLAVAFLQFFCYKLGLFPTKGFDWNHLDWAGRIHYTTMPLICNTLGAFTALTLFTRNGLLESLGSDYVRTARAKGVKPMRIIFVHALRNSLIPLAATFGHNVGFFLTGAFLVEVTFNIPGMGLLGYDALVHRNFPVFLGLLTLSSLAMLLGNILSDLCVALVDPRIRFDKAS